MYLCVSRFNNVCKTNKEHVQQSLSNNNQGKSFSLSFSAKSQSVRSQSWVSKPPVHTQSFVTLPNYDTRGCIESLKDNNYSCGVEENVWVLFTRRHYGNYNNFEEDLIGTTFFSESHHILHVDTWGSLHIIANIVHSLTVSCFCVLGFLLILGWYLVDIVTKPVHSIIIICPCSRNHTPALGSQFIFKDLSLCLPTFSPLRPWLCVPQTRTLEKWEGTV